MRGRIWITFILWLGILIAPAHAALSPDEMLDDPALEERARAISLELRCLVCQNQSIDDSDAPLARDLRLLVRERLQAGDSDAEVIAFVEARYGEYVLMRPRLAPHTLLLWATPFILLALGGIAALSVLRRRSAAPRAADLTAEERRRLERILDEGSSS